MSFQQFETKGFNSLPYIILSDLAFNNGYSGSEVDLHLFDAFESSYRLFCIGLAVIAAQAFYTICPDRAFTFLILTSAVILVSESEDHGIYQKQGHDYAAADAEPV